MFAAEMKGSDPGRSYRRRIRQIDIFEALYKEEDMADPTEWDAAMAVFFHQLRKIATDLKNQEDLKDDSANEALQPAER